MRVPGLTIDQHGNFGRLEPEARELLKAAAGGYRVHHAGAIVMLVRDETEGAAARDGETLAMTGNIKGYPLLGLMNLLGQGRETGRLVVMHGDTERVILLRDGDVAGVGSNLLRDRLGQFLVRLGKVTEAQLEAAQRVAERSGQRIGQVLVAQKIINPHELWSCIQEQITELFSEVTALSDGSFALYRVAADQPFPSTPPLSMQGLLLEAVRRADEMSVFRERIPHVNARLRRTARPARADMDPGEARALEALGSEASVAEVALRLKVAEFAATGICYQLLKAGLIEIVRATTPPKPAFVLSADDKERIYLFNLAFKEIGDELARHGHLETLLDGTRKYLADKAGTHAALFVDVDVDASGALGEKRLVQNLAILFTQGIDPTGTLVEALNELTFFMLFQCGELLDPKSDENLGRRVRLIHASLPKAAR